jgi:tetratricopeptide (TPR) repeat protein
MQSAAVILAMHLGLGAQAGWAYPLVAVVVLYFLWRSGITWASYYAFWLLGPMLLFKLAQQPLVLLLIPVALVLRRVLPDPFLLLKNARRIRSLSADASANAENVTVRRALAMLWLEMRRPARALLVVEEARRRLPDDSELYFIRGQALLGMKRWDEAVAAFLAVLGREPRLRYGEAYLRAADALIALARWDEAAEGLEHFVAVNRSSVEGWLKLARVRGALGEAEGEVAALEQARRAYRDSPVFHRRRQRLWYARVVIAGLAR